MLVAFCMYWLPRVLIASILRTLALSPLKAASNLRFVSGDDLDSATASLGDIFAVLEAKDLHAKENKYKCWVEIQYIGSRYNVGN